MYNNTLIMYVIFLAAQHCAKHFIITLTSQNYSVSMIRQENFLR
jgi:hypothetical protein